MRISMRIGVYVCMRLGSAVFSSERRDIYWPTSGKLALPAKLSGGFRSRWSYNRGFRRRARRARIFAPRAPTWTRHIHSWGYQARVARRNVMDGLIRIWAEKFRWIQIRMNSEEILSPGTSPVSGIKRGPTRVRPRRGESRLFLFLILVSLSRASRVRD